MLVACRLPVYPRLRRTMQGAGRERNPGRPEQGLCAAPGESYCNVILRLAKFRQPLNGGHNMERASHPSKITTDVAEVIEAARDVLRPFNSDTAWWRGHAKADWRLQAHVHRRDIKRQYDEATLIGHFVSRATSRSHRRFPDSNDCLRWLFLAQHYGLPNSLAGLDRKPTHCSVLRGPGRSCGRGWVHPDLWRCDPAAGGGPAIVSRHRVGEPGSCLRASPYHRASDFAASDTPKRRAAPV